MELDLAAYPKGDRQLWEIVDYIKSNGDRTETHYLEAKSDVDVSGKIGAAKIAKFILGAANRQPDVAAKCFGGHALMVLGVGLGTTPGVTSVDEKDLRNRVGAYVGRGSKPGWETRQLPLGADQKVIFVILVDPPEAGDQIWPCRKEFTEPNSRNPPLLRSGAIYVRPTSETREANADEIDELNLRVRGGGPIDADVEVRLVGEVYRIRYNPDLMDQWLAAKRMQLLQGQGGLGRLYGFGVDRRTRDQVVEEVDLWGEQVRKHWRAMAFAMAGYVCGRVSIEVTNHGQKYLKEPRILVTFPDSVVGTYGPDKEPIEMLPEPPRAWGAEESLVIGGLDVPYYSAGYGAASLDLVSSETGEVELNNEFKVGAKLKLALRDLRPQPYDPIKGDFVLFTSTEMPKDADHVEGEWLLTAADHHRNYRGGFTMRVVERDITKDLEDILYDDDDEQESGT